MAAKKSNEEKTDKSKKEKSSKKPQEPHPGDRVSVETPVKVYEGRILESPEDEQDTILLKTDSGYNIGLNKKSVSKTNLMEREGFQKPEVDLKEDPRKPNIGMIITGGTIAARLNPRKGGVDWLTSTEELFRYYPKLFEKVNVKEVKIPFTKASEDMDSVDWKKLSRETETLLNREDIKGVVITHGTDFLHYTSSALSLMLNASLDNKGNGEKKLNKPVVLTYSQRSVDRASSDANLNLQAAALTAVSDIAEVTLVGHANTNDNFCYVMSGCKVRKMHTSRRDAFEVINDKPIAKVFPEENKIESLKNYNSRETEEENNSNKKIKAESKFDDSVALLKFYPGQDPDILDYYYEKGYKGVVLEMSGLGHVATSRARAGKSWTSKLKEVQSKGMVIVAVPQTLYGRLDPYVYSNGRELQKTGITYLGDMLPETAFVKLGWVLGHEDWFSKNMVGKEKRQKVKELMLTNLTGEINDRLEE